MTGPGGDTTEVVRLFHGWAESAIWFPDPLPYGESDLSPALVEDLVAWDKAHYAGLTDYEDHRPAEVRQASDELGVRLARRLAGEIGDEFVVEVDRGDGAGQLRLRAPGPARNPEAAAAFRSIAAATRAERAY